MTEELTTPLFLLSPLAVLGAGLMVALVIGLTLQRFKIPKLYGAVIAGLLLGASGAGLIDRALLGQFQELMNGAAALVLFEVGRKMDLAWLLRSGRQGRSLLLATLVRGAAAALVLGLLGLPWGAAVFIGSILIAVNPVILNSMIADENASGTSTFASANMVGVSNLVALLALGITLAWTRSHGGDADTGFGAELVRQGGKLVLGAAIAGLCYGVYALATRLCKVPATMRPGMLLAALLIDLGLCSVTASSALLSLLLMGVLLRNAEKRDNVFQAQLATAQDIGYVLLFLMSAALVDLPPLLHLLQPRVLLAAGAVFLVRIAATRLALWPASAWDARKKHAIALSMCSLVSYGGLVVDSTLNAYTGLDPMSTAVMSALLTLNVLLAPGLTWFGLRLAGETYRGGSQ
jgi:Kef-type K+ transport system membrane component KefB